MKTKMSKRKLTKAQARAMVRARTAKRAALRPTTKFGGGISITAAITGTIPTPKHELKWGENIPKDVMAALHAGETAMLHDPDGNPHELLLMDYFGTIREQRVEPPNDQALP